MREDIPDLTRRLHTLEAAVRDNPFPMLWLDTDLNILSDNGAFTEMSGIPHDRLVGMNTRDLSVTTQKGEGVKTALSRGVRSYAETTIDFPTGTRALEQYSIPVADPSGARHTVLVVLKDVTEEQKNATKMKEMMKNTEENARALTRSARELKAAMDAMAKGDLTVSLALRDDDPLRTLKQDYLATQEELKQLFRRLAQTIREVEGNTKDAGKSSEEIARAIEGVAVKSQKAAEDSRKKLEEIDEVAGSLADLSAAVEEIANTCQEVLAVTEETAQAGDQAEDLGRQATEKMRAVETIARENVDEITDLNHQVQEINKIVKLITDISNQTNLLALNAAIEAARAGEHGRGFAVVAGEVRNLAGESKKATGDIEDLIVSIQTKSMKTAGSMETAYAEIHGGIESVDRAVGALHQISRGAKDVAGSVSEIAKATEDQASSAARVNEGMERNRAQTRLGLKDIEDMAALVEEVSASAQEVGSGAQEVARRTTGLREQIHEIRMD
ncbi:methyl-accepting chemotaxis protein [uncultured Methanofollis sp.]|uniref:methyl-accepting chemotaxis protein n=1 Tax=uncultured Methanofollis sp. TaxID=262500 RepID=UPI00262F3C6C|nr:methyl-accepting chemotaxis protein [uncultured Methanofollis sp.]